jgi:hypothetical protein
MKVGVAGRREALIKHMAQLNKAYLYDFGTIENGFYARGAADAAKDLSDQLSKLGSRPTGCSNPANAQQPAL